MFAVFAPRPQGAPRASRAAVARAALAACEPMAAIGGGAGPRSTPARRCRWRCWCRGRRRAAAALSPQASRTPPGWRSPTCRASQIDLRVYDTGGSRAGGARRGASGGERGRQDHPRPALRRARPMRPASPSPAAGVNVLAFSNNPTIAGGNVFILGPTFAQHRRPAGPLRRARRAWPTCSSSTRRRPAGQLGRDAIAARGRSANGAAARRRRSLPAVAAGHRRRRAGDRGAGAGRGRRRDVPDRRHRRRLPLLAAAPARERRSAPPPSTTSACTRWDIRAASAGAAGPAGRLVRAARPGDSRSSSTPLRRRLRRPRRTRSPASPMTASPRSARWSPAAGPTRSTGPRADPVARASRASTASSACCPTAPTSAAWPSPRSRTTRWSILDPAPSSFGGAGF